MDFFRHYLQYHGESEVPAVYNRWAAIVALGALLGRRFYLDHGSFKIYPNMYCMLLGSSGTRKSTAIRTVKKLIQAAGYNTIAADRTSKEKFLMDLAGEDIEETKSLESVLDDDLFGGSQDDAEMFIMADEANDFFGISNMEFLSILGNLWDYEGAYTNRIKTGKSISINNPTISILSGNTPTNFAAAFPPEILGQGFFSRILLIYGEPNGKRIPFPTSPSEDATAEIVKHFLDVRNQVVGKAELTGKAERLLSEIYVSNARVNDVRFESYSNRRFVHLMKLCLVVAASRLSTSISAQDVITANTFLTHAETYMPKALGEFGKARNSDISDKVLRIINSNTGVTTLREIWSQVSNDLENIAGLGTILQNLSQADKIQSVPALGGFLPKTKVTDQSENSFVDMSLITQEEKDMPS